MKEMKSTMKGERVEKTKARGQELDFTKICTEESFMGQLEYL